MNKEISKITTDLDTQANSLVIAIFNLKQVYNQNIPDYVKRMVDIEISRLSKVLDNVRKDMVQLGEVNKTLVSDKNAIQNEISALDVTIVRLQNAINPRMTTNDKNRLTVITSYLIDTRNKIATHIAQFGQTSPSYIQKMLAGAKALCEEHEDIVKNIVDEPNITCVTNNNNTTPTANSDSDTPCFTIVDKLSK